MSEEVKEYLKEVGINILVFILGFIFVAGILYLEGWPVK